MNKKSLLASVLVFVEDSDNDTIQKCLDNLKSQTYKNIEVIISSFKNDNDEEIKLKASKMFLNVRWINQSPNINFINDALKSVNGDIVFYKTINNVLWYPRHIEAHIEDFSREKSLKWSLSHIENKDLSKHQSKFNTLSFRISNPPKMEEIVIDEVCHICNLKTDWTKCVIQDETGTGFLAGNILKQWIEGNARGSIPSEITVIQWVQREESKNNNNKENYESVVGAPSITEIKEDIIESEEGIEIKRIFPTVVGNINFKDYNNNILNNIQQTQEIQSVGIKRTMGMGDVLLVEPIIKSVRNKFPNAEINFYTKYDDAVEYFKNKPDNVINITDQELLKDYLSETNNQIKFDLDLSYESRVGSNFIDAYIESTNTFFENDIDKNIQLEIKEERIIKENYIVVCGDHSGWAGKTWPLSYYEEVINHLQNKGYIVIETGSHHTDLTPTEYHNCEFNIMMNLIAYCDMFIGTDNGPMHISRGFNKPAVLVNGAALSYKANPNRDNVLYIQNSLNKNCGIKHKFFFNLKNNGGLTFMPVTNGDDDCGLHSISSSYVIEGIEKLLNKDYSFEKFNNVGDDIENMKVLTNGSGISLINV